MRDKTLVVAWVAFVLGLLAYSVQMAARQAAAPAPMVKSMPADRAMPATVVILRDVPDRAYLCAEIADRPAACRTVGEARWWLRQAQKAAK